MNSYERELYYIQLEKYYNEKELLKQVNDFKNVIITNNNNKTINRRSNSNSRSFLREGLYLFGKSINDRKTEKFIVTKSNKKRLFKSL